MREIKHPVKSPSRIGSIIGMIAIISSQSILVLRIWDHRGIFYASLTVILLCLVVLLLALYRTYFKKTTVLCLSNEQIILNGIIINSRDIKVIMTRGTLNLLLGYYLTGGRSSHWIWHLGIQRMKIEVSRI